MADPTALYSYQGQEPQVLPYRIRLNDGTAPSDPTTYTDEQLAEAGYTGPYTKPEFNGEVETQAWNFEEQNWVTTPIPNEVFWEKMRDTRNSSLSASDWSQLSDAPLTSSQKTQWKTYRQALRDLPINTEDPKNIIWPLPPKPLPPN